MKKILLASSALVLLGGAAFADVTLSGSAEMGAVGGKLDGTARVQDEETGLPVNRDYDYKSDFEFWSDMDVTFTLSGDTGNGVEFGASVDLDDAVEGAGFDPTVDSDFAVFVSGDWGTVTLGDTDGAFDWAMQDTSFGMAGTINDNEEHLGYDGMNLMDGFYDGQVARYDYSFGSFGFALSAEVDDDRANDEAAEGEVDYDDPMLGIGGKYTLDTGSGSWTFGAAYQGVGGDIYVGGLSAAGNIGGFSAGLAYYAGKVAGIVFGANDDGTNIEFKTNTDISNKDSVTNIKYLGGSLAYTWDAFTIGVNGGQYDFDNADSVWGAGITAAYDLGGGLELQTGYGKSVAKGKGEASDIDLEGDTYSFGLAMSF